MVCGVSTVVSIVVDVVNIAWWFSFSCFSCGVSVLVACVCFDVVVVVMYPCIDDVDGVGVVVVTVVGMLVKVVGCVWEFVLSKITGPGELGCCLVECICCSVVVELVPVDGFIVVMLSFVFPWFVLELKIFSSIFDTLKNSVMVRLPCLVFP